MFRYTSPQKYSSPSRSSPPASSVVLAVLAAKAEYLYSVLALWKSSYGKWAPLAKSRLAAIFETMEL